MTSPAANAALRALTDVLRAENSARCTCGAIPLGECTPCGYNGCVACLSAAGHQCPQGHRVPESVYAAIMGFVVVDCPVCKRSHIHSDPVCAKWAAEQATQETAALLKTISDMQAKLKAAEDRATEAEDRATEARAAEDRATEALAAANRDTAKYKAERDKACDKARKSAKAADDHKQTVLRLQEEVERGNENAECVVQLSQELQQLRKELQNAMDAASSQQKEHQDITEELCKNVKDLRDKLEIEQTVAAKAAQKLSGAQHINHSLNMQIKCRERIMKESAAKIRVFRYTLLQLAATLEGQELPPETETAAVASSSANSPRTEDIDAMRMTLCTSAKGGPAEEGGGKRQRVE